MILDAPSVGFLDAPIARDLEALAADVAVVGVPYGVPYGIRHVAPSAADAPRAVRERSARFGRMAEHHDFDLGGTLFDAAAVLLADVGDVPGDPRDVAGNAARATAAVRAVLSRGALPVVLGGDDSITALALRAFEGHGPLHVLQIDAHLDFRDEVDGVRDGYSSPMRRVSEMAWVRRIVHVGGRGIGSARPQDVQDTLAKGNAIVGAREVRARGVERVLDEFPHGERYYVAFDCDGMDPAVMPGVVAPMPGGLEFYEAADLLQGLARRGQVAGISIAEFSPALDVNGITALAITRLLVNLLGAMARGGTATAASLARRRTP